MLRRGQSPSRDLQVARLCAWSEVPVVSTPVSVNDILGSEVVVNDPAEQQTAVLRRYWFVFSRVGSLAVTFGDIAAALDTLWAADYKQLVYNSATYNGTRVRRFFPVAPQMAQWEVVTANAGVGTAGAVALPTQTCGLISLSGDLIGKSAEGRQYVPFPSASDNVTTGTPSSTYLTLLSALGQDLSQPVVVTGVSGGSVTIVPGLFSLALGRFTQINAHLQRAAWATQKRRGAFGRVNRPPF